jgi:hypothetical protein
VQLDRPVKPASIDPPHARVPAGYLDEESVHEAVKMRCAINQAIPSEDA